jgi:hypothetical protein
MTSDLKLKIGSKDEVLWKEVAREAKVLIENHKNSLIIQKAMLALAEQKITEEQKKNGK